MNTTSSTMSARIRQKPAKTQATPHNNHHYALVGGAPEAYGSRRVC